MKIIIAGGRDFIPTKEDWFKLRDLLIQHKCTEVVSGGCVGADKVGERIADKLAIKCTVINAEWARLGDSAGPVRNMRMAIYADAAILLRGGRGTDDMRKKMKLMIKPILYDQAKEK